MFLYQVSLKPEDWQPAPGNAPQAEVEAVPEKEADVEPAAEKEPVDEEADKDAA
jgi:hypothetical protein